MPVARNDAPVEPPARGDVAAAGDEEPEDRPIAPGDQRDGLRRARAPAAAKAQALDGRRVAAKARVLGGTRVAAKARALGGTRVAAKARVLGGTRVASKTHVVEGGGRPGRRTQVVDGGRRARRRAARRSQMARRNTLATRRGELVAASRSVAAAAADASSHTSASRRRGGLLRRAVAVAALVLLPAAGSMLVLREAPAAPALSRADGSYLSAQVVAADRRVRTQLAHLRHRATARALDRTRESIATMRSLAVEIGRARGAEAGRLRAALGREGAWLDAVRSTLSNPRSPLRARLAVRDRALRRALAALRIRAAPREGAARHLIDYARSRVRAAVDQEKSASLTQ
jgi:hypothetical protein